MSTVPVRSAAIHAPEIKIQITSYDKPVVYADLMIDESVGNHHRFSFVWKPGDFQSDLNLQKQVFDYIGKDVSITIGGHKFKGLITEIMVEEEQAGQVFMVTGQSPTVLIDDAPRSTSYYKQNLQQIVQKSVEGADTQLLKLANAPAFKDEIHYLAQYNESDFAFLNRLATRFGEWFYYDGEKLFFGGTQNSGLTLRNGSDVSHLSFQASLQPHKFGYGGTDAHKGEKLEGDAADLQYSGDGFAKTAVDKSKSFYSRKDAKRRIHLTHTVNKKQLDTVKDLDAKAASARALKVKGQSTVAELRPGYRFKIELSGNQPEFIALSVTHRSDQPGNYHNYFTGVPAKAEVPPYTNPHVIRKCEMQPATVKDNKDSDKIDRVKVKFQWSENSPWLRISAPHAGKDKGWHFIPEIGEDVMVDFEGGDVDKPFVVGMLYTGKAKSGQGDSDNDIKSLKTRSGNTIILNDKEGSITIQDPKGSVVILKGDETIEVRSKKKILIQSEEINIKADKDINIEAGGKMNIKSNKAMSIGTQDEMKQESMKGFKISTMDKLQTSSMQDTKISSTMNLSLEGTIKAELKGTQAAVQGTAQATVKAAMVMIN